MLLAIVFFNFKFDKNKIFHLAHTVERNRQRLLPDGIEAVILHNACAIRDGAS